MSKIFVNEDPQAPAPAPAVAQPAAATKDVAKILAMLLGLAIAAAGGWLLYHHWRFALPALLAVIVFACWSSRSR